MEAGAGIQGERTVGRVQTQCGGQAPSLVGLHVGDRARDLGDLRVAARLAGGLVTERGRPEMKLVECDSRSVWTLF